MARFNRKMSAVPFSSGIPTRNGQFGMMENTVCKFKHNGVHLPIGSMYRASKATSTTGHASMIPDSQNRAKCNLKCCSEQCYGGGVMLFLIHCLYATILIKYHVIADQSDCLECSVIKKETAEYPPFVDKYRS